VGTLARILKTDQRSEAGAVVLKIGYRGTGQQHGAWGWRMILTGFEILLLQQGAVAILSGSERGD
jgi:hypothetical protein